uniref:Uncharacterized protein n=1 Tax=mine drainage metagenome TaxID=410659 RepID=E6PKT5_9ZZZZ
MRLAAWVAKRGVCDWHGQNVARILPVWPALFDVIVDGMLRLGDGLHHLCECVLPISPGSDESLTAHQVGGVYCCAQGVKTMGRIRIACGNSHVFEFGPRRPPEVLHLWPPKLLHPGRGDLTH